MKLILLTASLGESGITQSLNHSYVAAFTRPGFAPLIVPNLPVGNREFLTPEIFAGQHKAQIDGYVNAAAGVVLTGGSDLSPLTFGAEIDGAAGFNMARDLMEVALARAFMTANKPILGICRGSQLLGNLLDLPNFQQDISHCGEAHSATALEVKNRQEAMHTTYLRGELREYLEGKLGRDVPHMLSNSFHHQGHTLSPSGATPDHKWLKAWAGHVKYRGNPEDRAALFAAWQDWAIKLFEHKGRVEIMGHTGVVVEAWRSLDAQVIGVQNHVEEAGAEGLLVEYFLDKVCAA